MSKGSKQSVGGLLHSRSDAAEPENVKVMANETEKKKQKKVRLFQDSIIIKIVALAYNS